SWRVVLPAQTDPCRRSWGGVQVDYPVLAPAGSRAQVDPDVAGNGYAAAEGELACVLLLERRARGLMLAVQDGMVDGGPAARSAGVVLTWYSFRRVGENAGRWDDATSRRPLVPGPGSAGPTFRGSVEGCEWAKQLERREETEHPVSATPEPRGTDRRYLNV